MTDTLPQPKTILEIILEWSSDRPEWQRDALRRIVQAQKLSDTDIAELTALCKQGRTTSSSTPAPKPGPA